jgi:multisubunit Na+/H+ antiporter MnhC subunit
MLSTVTLSIGFLLILIGLWGILTRKNILKMILAFSILDTGVHVVMVTIGFIRGRTAPILNQEVTDALQTVVDPIPSALVLTAIVIGVAVTALMLIYAVQLYQKKQSLSIEEYEELRW